VISDTRRGGVEDSEECGGEDPGSMMGGEAKPGETNLARSLVSARKELSMLRVANTTDDNDIDNFTKHT
jgi:hypothetical protein